MARNTLAGKSVGKSPAAKYLRKNKAVRDKKKAYDKKYNSSVEQRRYRAELNKENRKKGTYGNKDGKDVSHTKNGKLVSEPQSKNRARNGKNGKSTKK
jgi:hypothetical protein